MSKVDIRNHVFSPNDHLFFDANIWLCIYGPMPMQRRRTGVYQQSWKQIRQRGATVHVDVLVISEFINRFTRWEYDQTNRQYADYKDFRKSQDFPPIAADVAAQVRRILGYARCCDSCFVSVDTNALLTEFSVGDSDFNDQMIAEICRSHHFTLVTDDGDFKSVANLPLITANGRLLTAP